MTRLIAIFVFVLPALAGCHGEPVPRDYQNVPSSMQSVDNPAQAPASQSSGATPEPESTAEGTSAPYEPAQAPPEPEPE